MEFRKLKFFPGWSVYIKNWTFTLTRGEMRLSWRIVIIYHYPTCDDRVVIYFTPWRDKGWLK